MSLRKYMHARNKYRKPPDYKQLATIYPEFCKVAIVDLAGNVRINFQNEESLRVLTKVLLKHDFNLDVKIPAEKLIPTLPLRLNYVLWIEDLIQYASYKDIESVTGIDVGTGAVCIYPLLLAKMFGCSMIGTEIDETSVETAETNIKNNNLENLIRVVKVSPEKVLKEAIEQDRTYDFVMCNPPFFENDKNLIKKAKRLPPRNAPTGNETELSVEGGEKTFAIRMIDESIDMQSKIRIYTIMLGQKKTLKSLLELLKKKQIENVTWTEFCQGHTTRWGLAWTFLPKDCLDLTKAPVIRKHEDSVRKIVKTETVEISFPTEDRFSTIDEFIHLFKGWMHGLHINMKELNIKDDEFNDWACQLEAQTDSWTHARRKRRLAKRLNSIIQSEASKNEDEAKCSNSSVTTDSNIDHKSRCDINEIHEIPTENISTDDSTCETPLLVCKVFVKMNGDMTSERNFFNITMTFERGHGGKNALETFRQYLINQLNLREYYQQRKEANVKRKKPKRSFGCKTAKVL